MTHEAITLRAAVHHERDDAARLLATAFTHDPIIAAVTDGAHDPEAAREAIFRVALAAHLQSGGELVLAERDSVTIGAALIADPQGGSLLRACRAAAVRLMSALRFAAIARRLAPGGLMMLNRADLASRRYAPRHPHHLLVAVGVTASARGLGVGRLLVEHTVDRARHDPRSWGVRLETENPHNAELYARWGFTTLGVVSMNAFDVHVMGRETRRSTQPERGQS